MSNINVSIQKYDPSKDAEPYFVTYEVPWKEHLTALEAIHYINENCEPIVFDYSCRGGLCGRCSCMIDGKASLSCFTPLDERDHTIEPLKGFNIIRDLIVDKETFMDSITNLKLSVQTSKDISTANLPNIDYDFWYNTLFHLDLCRECGNCMTICPVYNANPIEYVGPAQLSQVGLRMFDNLDQADRALQAYEMGIHNCTLCGVCEAVCPARIPHAELHKKMQEEAINKGYAPKNA